MSERRVAQKVDAPKIKELPRVLAAEGDDRKLDRLRLLVKREMRQKNWNRALREADNRCNIVGREDFAETLDDCGEIALDLLIWLNLLGFGGNRRWGFIVEWE